MKEYIVVLFLILQFFFLGFQIYFGSKGESLKSEICLICSIMCMVLVLIFNNLF